MPKRKRGAEPSLPEKLEQHENEVYKALKLAKGFERQRLGKRAQDKGVTDEKKERLEKEMEVLKGLDLQATAKTHLQTSLLKVKSIAASSDLPDVLKAAEGKKEVTGLDAEEEKARHNVTSALYNRDGVKKAVEKAVESVCEALAVPLPQKAKKAKKGEDGKGEQKAAKKEVEEKMDIDGESAGGSAFEGFESDVDEPGSVIGDDQLDEIKARVGMGAPQTCNACWKSFATDRLADKQTAESAPGLCKRTSKKGGCDRCKENGLACEDPAELVLPWCDAYQELDAHFFTSKDGEKKAKTGKLMKQVLSSILLTMRLLTHPDLEAMRTANQDITSRLYGSDDDSEEEEDGSEDDVSEEDEAAFQDEGALSKYDSRLGHSSDEDNDDDDDKEEKFFAQLRRQKAAAKQKEAVNLDDISGSDPGNDTDLGSLSDTSSRSASPLPQSKPKKESKPKPEPKAKVKKSKKGETFLPSLMGGYISGSESASDIDIAPPKKRLGQRQRQAIAEKKYGDKAKHVEKQKSQTKWDAKRGAVGADDRPPWKRGGGGGGDRRGRGRGDQQEEEQVAVQREVKPTKRDDVGNLHPSWEARKKAKEGLKAVAFEGAKITFD